MQLKRHEETNPALKVGIFLLALFALPSANGTFRPLFGATTLNNLSECTPLVRHAIKHAKENWGSFRFACINGVVQEVLVSEDSKINKEPAAFIMKNLGLFDLQGSSITVKFDGDVGTQFWKGHPISGSKINCKTLARNDQFSQNPRPISTRDLQNAPGVNTQDIEIEIQLVDPEFPMDRSRDLDAGKPQ